MSTNYYYVNQTNPEIFKVTPRPGGLAKIDLPPKRNRLRELASKLAEEDKAKSRSRKRSTTSSKKSKESTIDTKSTVSRKSLLTVTTKYDEPVDITMDNCPREFKMKQIISATPWSVEFDEYLEHLEGSKRTPDPFQDSVDMLAMTISVIMLLSKNYDKIDSNHFKWVLSYLYCIKDEFDKIPPNVQGIINHINQVTGGNIKSFLDEYEPPEITDRDTAVKISKLPPEEIIPQTPNVEPTE